MGEPLFNVAFIRTCTEAEGPGRRMAVWFQGCDILCRGCCNPELQAMEPRHLMALSELLGAASEAVSEHGVEGVTFLGGEPTLQRSLHVLAAGLKGMGLGIIMFTGRTIEEIPEELLESLDTVVDGRFDIDDIDHERYMVGSRNQRIINLTDRYAESTWFIERRDPYVEVTFGDGLMHINGAVYN